MKTRPCVNCYVFYLTYVVAVKFNCNCVLAGAQVQAAAPPTLKEPEGVPVSSTTPLRVPPDTTPPKPTVLQVINGGRNNVVVTNDRFVNGNKNCEKKPSEVVLNEHQKQTRPKSNDLNIPLNYEQSVVINNTNYHRIPINDTSSRRNHERHLMDQDCVEKQKPNGFTTSNSEIAAAVKSYPLKEELPHTNSTQEEIKMEVDECPTNSLETDRQNGFEPPKNECDKDHNASRFREESPGKEAHGMDRHPHKDHHSYDHLAAGADGSVRSDEGYHSHGYHDEVLTPPEDSSDSDDSDNNYVLDFRLVPDMTIVNKYFINKSIITSI